MQAKTSLFALLSAAMLLAACASGGTPHLMNLRSSTDGPDEFAILPQKSLEMPKDLKDLPEPTPGGTNLTDRDPKAEAIAALGGKAPKPSAGVPAGDQAVLAYADRFGVTADIRDRLAAEDLAWRKGHDGRLLERVFAVSVYYKAYFDFELDQFAELAFWRAHGVATPAAPPPLKGER